MITAKEAKTITDNCTYDKSKYYLTALNRNIKRAAADVSFAHVIVIDRMARKSI